MKNSILVIGLIGLMFAFSGCGDETTNVDSFNTTTTTSIDSYNTYTAEQQGILTDGYTPDVLGVCGSGYFWCSVEGKCLPEGDGASCPLAHTDGEEAEASEINESGV